MTLIGEAILHEQTGRPLYENDGYEGIGGGIGGRLWGRVNNDTTGGVGRTEKHAERRALQSIGPRPTDIVNPNILNTVSILPPSLTANPTIWKAPIRSVPSVWSTTAAAITRHTGPETPPRPAAYRHITLAVLTVTSPRASPRGDCGRAHRRCRCRPPAAPRRSRRR